MYSYDRAKQAATETSGIEYLDPSLPINRILSQFGTALEGKPWAKATGDSTFNLGGKTRDGRKFSGTGTVKLDAGLMIIVEVTIGNVEGTVEVGPVPDFLEKAEKLMAEVVEKATGQKELIFRSDSLKWTLKHIAEWHAGKPVDKKNLRGSLRDSAKSLDRIQTSEREQLQSLGLYDLVDQARKATSAAMRLLKD